MNTVDQEIQEPSLKSLFIEMFFEKTLLATGTAFLAKGSKRTLLVTARHNVTGRRQADGSCISKHGGVPNRMTVWHNGAGSIAEWVSSDYALTDPDDSPLWIEHPTLGSRADFVGLELKMTSEMVEEPYGLGDQHPQMLIRPADMVSVVGFPFGKNAGGLFAIWATGFIATEPALDFEEVPALLIDCRGRPGQSGAPVIAHRNGGGIPMVDQKKSNFYIGPVTNLIGIYSGRIDRRSDLGIVWKRSAIKELVDGVA